MNCYLLTGGLSRRMGRDKTSLLLGTRSFVDRVSDVASHVFDEVVAVDRDPERRFAIRTICEHPHEEVAPIFGLERALEDSAGARAWIIATDYPLMTAPLLGYLRKRFHESGADICVPRVDGSLHVLCAGYGAAALAEVRGRIQKKHFRIRDILESLRTVIVSEEELEPFGPIDAFRNVNTPEEYDAVLEIYEHER